MPELSIIIPVRNQLELTRKCLRYIKRSALPEDTEIIIVEDGSEEEERLPFEDLIGIGIEGFILRYHDVEAHGFGPCCNRGIELAKGKYIAIFNNDLFVPLHWYVALSEYLKNNYVTLTEGNRTFTAKLGMVSGGLVEPPVTEEEFWARHPHDYGQAFTYMHKGMPWLFKREFFEVVGTFDEQFVPGFYEDSDILLRGAMAGYAFGITQAVQSYHLSTATILQEWGPERKAQIAHENYLRFNAKWGIDGNHRIDIGHVLRMACGA